MDGTVSTQTTSTGLAAVKQEIERACREAKRDPATVTLVAVSKTFAADAIEPIIAAGQRVFGENRVQEAKAKWPALLERTPGLELHMIDRQSLCEALAKEISKQSRRPLLFVEINTGAEAQKAGVLPQDADAFLAQCRDGHGLTIDGLMCIPPAEEAPAPHFALTTKIAARNGLKLLSMGMSADYAVAIAMGATHVRVGSAIFGARA